MYNAAKDAHYAVDKEGEAPDLVCCDEVTGRSLGVEVGTAYYHTDAAKGLWDMMRGGSKRAGGAAVNPEDALAAEVHSLLTKKWNKSYGQHWVLVIHLDAPLTTAAEFEVRVLPSISVPRDPSPFEAVYARIKPEARENPDLAWWQLFPSKGRFRVVG